jgi:hypothetical protein
MGDKDRRYRYIILIGRAAFSDIKDSLLIYKRRCIVFERIILPIVRQTPPFIPPWQGGIKGGEAKSSEVEDRE